MKKTGIFILGVLTGIALSFLISILIVNSNSNKGLTFFEEAGECISVNSFRVFQVFDSGTALASERRPVGCIIGGGEITVLFVPQDGKAYYDDQIINVPSGKCVKQIGTFRYPTASGFEKTVPVVDILDK